MSAEHTYRDEDEHAPLDDGAELSWSSLAKTVKGVARNPTVAAIGKTALGGAAQGAMVGGPMGALLGVGGAALSGLTGSKNGAVAAAGPGLAQLAPLAAQATSGLPRSVQDNLAPLLQLLQNPQLAGLLGAVGGGGAASVGASEADADAQDSVYEFLVENGLAQES